MIKVIVLYPTGRDKTFDMDYYLTKHIPMITGLLGGAMKAALVDKGIGSDQPGVAPPYAAIGKLYFDSIEAFQNSFGTNAQAILADVPNYTNIEPVVLISEVMV
jgi:uncharacterized protein (TIGR02118 family)